MVRNFSVSGTIMGRIFSVSGPLAVMDKGGKELIEPREGRND